MQYPAPATYTTYAKSCGHKFVYEGGSRSLDECASEMCLDCRLKAGTVNLGGPLTHTAEGMVIAALERGVDVEARFAAWNEDELSEDEDW